MMQRQANVEQQRHGNPLLPENLVKVLRRAMHLLGQPGGGTPLTLQLLLDDRPHMKLFVIHHTY